MTGSTQTRSRARHKSLESPVPGKRARRVRREAARKRPASIRNTGPRRAAHPTRGNVLPIWRPGEPGHRAKLRRLTRRWITLTEGRGSEGGGLWVTRLTWTGNREGTTAWRERMERCEGVDGAAVQDPCDMAKTGLFEAQFPGMEMCILRHTTPGAEPPVSGESPLLRPNLPAGGR